MFGLYVALQHVLSLQKTESETMFVNVWANKPELNSRIGELGLFLNDVANKFNSDSDKKTELL